MHFVNILYKWSSNSFLQQFTDDGTDINIINIIILILPSHHFANIRIHLMIFYECIISVTVGSIW